MIIFTFAITCLKIFATVVNTIVLHITGKQPPSIKRPNNLNLAPDIGNMNYMAHLGSSRQGGNDATSTISEYRISPEFHLDLREDGATFTKEWSNFTQTCHLPMVEFVELLSYSPAILQFSEDSAHCYDSE